ncbi:MAG: hypothetical protein ACPGED_11705 [Flavobacteriales bacterium]
MKKLNLSLFFILLAAWCFAGNAKVLIYGYVTEGNVNQIIKTDKKAETVNLEGVKIFLYQNGELVKEMNNRNTGFYSLILPTGSTYEIMFERKGYISKKVQILTEDVPDKQYDEAFKMITDISLFPEMEGKDLSDFSQQVVAKCKYNLGKDRMSWDMVYAREAFGKFLDLSGVLKEEAMLTE